MDLVMFQSWALTHPYELFIIGYLLGIGETLLLAWLIFKENFVKTKEF